MMSHEPRTPMTAIIGIAEMLGQESLEPGHAEKVGRIAASGKSLMTLLDDVLDFAKIDAARDALRVLVAEDNEAIRFLMRGMFEKRGHTVQCVEDAGNTLNGLGDAIPEIPPALARFDAAVAARAGARLRQPA